MARQVLIIDDEPAIAQTLKPVLAAHQYDVTTASNAAEALRKARQCAYDVALLDLGLPDADGKEIIANLHGYSCRSVIVISARHQETEKIAALDGGADDYLNKPFSIDELLARIRAALPPNERCCRQSDVQIARARHRLCPARRPVYGPGR